MFKNPSLITRIGIGKSIGLIFGLLGFVLMPYFWPEADPMMRWGILLWYITLGAIIGLFGVFTWHPVLHLPMPWWFRAPFLGAWMNFVLVLFTYDRFQAMMSSLMGTSGALASPFWFVLEGAVIGLIIGYCATRFGGEGKATVEESG